MKQNEIYIKRCIELAKNGLGSTYPNPLVGSVIVLNNRIIGEGWHYQAGKPHAEVNAIESVKDSSTLKDATIYVSLEPCSHFGKTPPCSDLIIQKGIKKVVIGTIDPFAKVSGNGIKKLINAGCDVTVGVLEKECKELNTRFFTFHTQKRPYIILKWAETKDGYIAPVSKDKREPFWITNPYSKQIVHKWRSEEQAILVGNKTVVLDNPQLTVRNWHGNHPIRVVIDRSGIIPDNSAVFDQTTKTIIITSKESTKKNTNTIIYETINTKDNLAAEVCEILYKHNIQSIIIEGGTRTILSFLNANLWDESRVFVGNSIFGAGTKAPDISGKLISTSQIINDTLSIYHND
ncbi:bifunctional diaminohydroxyphosphoribosylaminopyrimidine deaminase/5-amino-6-(5-phosphoribosylamino)uracil reductase RibD [Aquimarina pacifica]|uniref:bifunctional diaminohydroxyphosphoribosylaminopyrimidine deaminase/5-amino-6-(5-phosphoribosylamino)uracil reductase RibD n=1 Tax=Aquimarina pacifica TaxID=1296415 RepID=UPI000470F75B|nr:bifunctional diaminohydroxyphosphoribosylaminopyrimidine deaminase/5-amino-6-(5-phosphoribosylamino)uracil reductase RibD [Aquimarina pacifica]